MSAGTGAEPSDFPTKPRSDTHDTSALCIVGETMRSARETGDKNLIRQSVTLTAMAQDFDYKPFIGIIKGWQAVTCVTLPE